MLSFHVCLGSAYLLLAAALALPTDHPSVSSRTEIAESHASSFSDGIEGLVLPNVLAKDHDDSGGATDGQSKLGERALPLQPSSQHSTSLHTFTNTNISAHNLTAFVPPICWPGVPALRARTAISEPRDCRRAVGLVLAGAGAMTPMSWATWQTWTHGSCSIRLLPAVVVSRDEFSRYDIAHAASRIQTSCINDAHGFRGGIIAVGRGKMFDVSVEASRSTPFQPDGDRGVSES